MGMMACDRKPRRLLRNVPDFFLGVRVRLLYTVPSANCPAGRARNAKSMLKSASLQSVETRTSWVVATVVLIVMAVAFGAPWITVVALKNIAAEVNGERSIPAFAGALVWIGAGLGGIIMGQVAERFGIRIRIDPSRQWVSSRPGLPWTGWMEEAELADAQRVRRSRRPRSGRRP